MAVKSALIVVDNLRIGGFQRLALDQAYCLSERGFEVNLVVMTNELNISESNFVLIEQSIISKLKVKITWIKNERLPQLIALRKILRLAPEDCLLISHSLRATTLLRFCRLSLKKKPTIITTIHQLPTLSHKKQRFQRFLYAQFTDILFAYSRAVQSDWVSQTQTNYIFKKLIFRKEIRLLRNGVYIPRLPSFSSTNEQKQFPRLIFLGRNTAWKGLSTFFQIISRTELAHFHVLFLVPSKDAVDIESLPESVRKRVNVISGKTVASYNPLKGDVHVYPANYGEAAQYVESVSLNCLELASLGIPTLLTKWGLDTWPDLEEFGIFQETDWSDMDDLVEKVLKLSSVEYSSDQIESMRRIIDLNNQIDVYEEIYREDAE
jgi:hypothetical protein